MALSVALALALPSVVSAQLTGVLSSSPNNSDIVTAVVTNTGTQNISVLAWNNVFDMRTLSKPFIITDTAGNDVLIGGGHIMQGGMTKDHFHDLPPGSNFSRKFNISDYLVNQPGAPASTKDALIKLPGAYQGLVGHNGTYSIHPAADVQRSSNGSVMALGDFSKVNLAAINLTSNTLNETLSIPAGARNTTTKRGNPKGSSGMQISSDCTGQGLTAAQNGVNDASYLAVAGQNAVDHPSYPGAVASALTPLSIWFGSGYATYSANIKRIYGLIQNAADGNFSPTIGVHCADLSSACDPTTLGYQHYNGNGPFIVVCPLGYSLQRNHWPCTGIAGTESSGSGHSIGGLIIHESTHVSELTGYNLWPRDASGTPEVYGAYPSLNLAATQGSPAAVNNPTNWEYMASYSWDTGLGGNPWNDAVCPQFFIPPTASTPNPGDTFGT